MSFDFEYGNIKASVPKSCGKRRSWNLDFPVSTDWNKRKKRLMLVFDHVPTENLSSKQFMSGETGEMVVNVLKYANSVASSWGCKEKLESWGIACVPFNYFKTYDLDQIQQQVAEDACLKRIKQIIEKLDPTHIHFFGDRMFQLLYGKDTEYRGRVFTADGIKVSSNISITNEAKYGKEDSDADEDDEALDFMDDDDFFNDALGVDRANLLGHAGQNLARLINGSFPFSLRKLKASYVVVDTIKKFDKLMKRLHKAPYFSYDTETFNLSATQNGIALAQFTLPDEDTVSYEVPLKHMSAPWDDEQFRYIYSELRKLFAKEFPTDDWNVPFLIGQNIGFDLRLTRVELGIPVIFYRVADIMALGHSLDENIKALTTKSVADLDAQAKNRPFALDVVMARYENTFYYDAEFSKGDRHLIAEIPLTKQVYEYGAMDTVGPMHLYHMMSKQAELLENDGKPFGPIFQRIVKGVYSDTIHVQSHMMQNGATVDFDYVVKQYAVETSDIEKEREQLIKSLYSLKSVKKTNKKMLKVRNLPEEDLFAGMDNSSSVWVFDIDVTEHRRDLFFKTLDVPVLSYTAGGHPQMGKEFKAHYSNKDSNHYFEEVDMFKSIEESKKVRGYIKSYFEKLCEADGQHDFRLRAQYGFSMVVTGRSNSFSPSLQQVPQHGQYAKIIKRCFVAKKNTIIVKMDYSAHEIGVWCILSGDENLATTFKTIFNNWLAFRKNHQLKSMVTAVQNDAHKLNYSLFTGTKVEDITKPMRHQSKGISFGVMFGKHVNSMARDLGLEIDEMQAIYDRFFGKFVKAKKWLDKTVSRARSNYYTVDGFGCRRHLYGYMTANRGICGAMDRRAQNSPIQGFASRLGFTASRILTVKLYHAFKSENMYSEPYWDKETKRIVVDQPNCLLTTMVHDSTELEIDYELVPLVTQAMEHCATNGLTDYCKKMYKIDWLIRPQVDFDICDTADKLTGWNFTKDFEPVEDSKYPKPDAANRGEYDKMELSSSLETCVNAAAASHRQRYGKKAVSKQMLADALTPTKRIKRMQKQFPLDLTPW